MRTIQCTHPPHHYNGSNDIIEHSVDSNTKNALTPPLAVHSRHVTTNPLW